MTRRDYLRGAVKAGGIGGAVVWYLVLVGMVEKFGSLAIVGSRITLNWLLVFGPAAFAGYLSMRPKVTGGERVRANPAAAMLGGLVAGAGTALATAAGVALVNIIGPATVRSVFISVSPTLLAVISFHTGVWAGTVILAGGMVLAGLAGGSLQLLADRWRRAVLNGLVAVLFMALLERTIAPAFDQVGLNRNWIYSSATLGLTIAGGIIVFAVAALATILLRGHSVRDLFRGEVPTGSAAEGAEGEEPHPLESRVGRRRRAALIAWFVIAALLLVLPYLVGPVVSRILGSVGIFLLLGIGLNIVVGFAGLLDLGYVAFFAVGAYFTAVLTGAQRVTFVGFRPPTFGAHLSFFVALPVVVLIAALIGVLIGAPVLRLRGDYLAIVTLGFGEIARVIFGSTWARGLFGGSQGMSAVTGAPIGSFEFQSDPRHFYYLALFFCLLAVYVSWRLANSRVGRAWNAMREDEQVADVMGISTVRYKLLAFAMGGAIGSIGGAIFAVSIGSLTIASFQVIVSITALAVVILGGLGSIPGVVVGALVLIGLPGLLSEFETYQLLIYGAVLIAIMVLRPQGLVPNVRRSRELQDEERAQDQWAKELVETESATALEPSGGELQA